MITEFGKVLRKLRIDRGEILKNMADKLEMTSSYLSAIECGKRNIPSDFIEKLASLYELDESQIAELNSAKDESLNSIEICIEGKNASQRDLALQFASKFNDIDEDFAKQMLSLQKKRRRTTMSTYFKKCDVCNKDIVAQHWNTKYCPDCKIIMRKKQQGAAYKKYEEKAKQEYEDNIIRIRNSYARISAVAAEARKAGLTYGKYVASLRDDANNEIN